jgi:transmembrane sensor
VEEGVVKVFRDGAFERSVRAGETALFAGQIAGRENPSMPEAVDSEVADLEASAAAKVGPPSPKPSTTKRPPKRIVIEWRSLADQGSYSEAWLALQHATPRDEPEDLLRAADVARLSGHAQAAVPSLQRVMAHFASDSRAPLAAFTLGRVLLEDVSAPAEAAKAFSQAQLLAPDGPLAGNALAREVEALAKAGEARQASLRAKQYLQRYPRGLHLQSVKRWGAIE